MDSALNFLVLLKYSILFWPTFNNIVVFKIEKKILFQGALSTIKRHLVRNLSKLQFLLRESLKLRCNPFPFPVFPTLLLKFRPFPVLMFRFPFNPGAPPAPDTLLIDLTDPARETGKLRMPLTFAERALRIT